MDPHDITPWWGRIGKILAYPFNSHGLIAIAFLTVVDIFRGFSGMGLGMVGIFVYLVTTGVIVSVLFSIIRASADGYETFPLVDFGGDIFSDWVIPALKFVLMGMALFAPAIVFFIVGGAARIFGGDDAGAATGAGSYGLAFVFLGLAFFLYPLATVILAMSESLINALNPAVWFQILSRVFMGYLGLVLPALFLSQSFIPLPGPLNLVAAPLKIYLAMCGAHLLGWFIFQHHQILGHNPRIFSERQEMVPPQLAHEGGPDRKIGAENFQEPEVAAPQMWGEDPSASQAPAQRAVDMSVPDIPEPQYGGAFTGAAPQGANNQQPVATTWPPPQGPPAQTAAPGAEPQAWDPFGGTANGGSNNSFLEIDDGPGSGPQPQPQPVNNNSLPAGMSPSGLELDAPPPPEPAPEPEPEPVLEPEPEPEPAPATPAAPALDPETETLRARFQADLASGNEQAATLSAALLIHKFWNLRLVERTNQTYRDLVASFTNACLRPDDQVRIARQLDAMGDASTALTAWRNLVMVHREHPQSPRALLRCAELYHEMGHADYAKQCLQGVMQKYPNHEVAFVAETRLKQMA